MSLAAILTEIVFLLVWGGAAIGVLGVAKEQEGVARVGLTIIVAGMIVGALTMVGLVVCSLLQNLTG